MSDRRTAWPLIRSLRSLVSLCSPACRPSAETEVMRKAAEHAHQAVQQFQAHAEKKIMQQMNQRAGQSQSQPEKPAVIHQLTAQISSKFDEVKEAARLDWQDVKNKFKQ
jgi:uncharacterized protein YdiU (UPF0061 family)